MTTKSRKYFKYLCYSLLLEHAYNSVLIDTWNCLLYDIGVKRLSLKLPLS